MKSEFPESVINLANSCEGQLLKSKGQTSDSDLVVTLSFRLESDTETVMILEFIFPEESKVAKFRDIVMRGYEDLTLFGPWRLSEYLKQPACDYFTRSSNGGALRA